MPAATTPRVERGDEGVVARLRVGGGVGEQRGRRGARRQQRRGRRVEQRRAAAPPPAPAPAPAPAPPRLALPPLGAERQRRPDIGEERLLDDVHVVARVAADGLLHRREVEQPPGALADEEAVKLQAEHRKALRVGRAAHREEDPILLALRDEREDGAVDLVVGLLPADAAQALALLGHVRRPAQRG